jgi:twitching motility protein PilU
MIMEKLLTLMAEKKASDLFLSPGSPVNIKINGISLPVNQQRLDSATVTSMIREIVTERQWQLYEDHKELNVGYGLRGIGSFRVNVFTQRASPACVIRYIPGDVPELSSLSLPPVVSDIIMEKRGLVLVVGSTGSGKSTTLASLINYRNEQKSGHILTIEDPIEFVFKSQRSIINQRQIGSDTDTLQIALKNAMRQAPDIILIGEIRDPETMTAALAYAQSGHLVLSTLHANNAYNALNRIINFYPPETRRVLLSDMSTTLKAIISQRLIRSKAGGRLPAVEVLLNTRHIAELIEQGRLSDVKEAMEKSLAPGSQTFEDALVQMVRDDKISKEDALANSDSPTNMLWALENAESPKPVESTDSALVSQQMPEKPKDPGGASFSEFLLNV